MWLMMLNLYFLKTHNFTQDFLTVQLPSDFRWAFALTWPGWLRTHITHIFTQTDTFINILKETYTHSKSVFSFYTLILQKSSQTTLFFWDILISKLFIPHSSWKWLWWCSWGCMYGFWGLRGYLSLSLSQPNWCEEV